MNRVVFINLISKTINITNMNKKIQINMKKFQKIKKFL